MTTDQAILTAHSGENHSFFTAGASVCAPATETAAGFWWSSVNHCVHVIDDDARFLEVMRFTLQAVEVHNQCYVSAEHFLATYTSHDADCVLLDLRMPGMDGLGLLKALRDRVAPPILMLSAYSDAPDIVCSIQRGALDYLLKPIREKDLLTKVAAAMHKNWTDKQRYGDLIRRLQSLSDREREVMTLFVNAKSTTQIARLLSISPKTVEKHRVNIFRKLNVDSVPALICFISGASS
jgi:FixJ family two-component response regulator